MADSPAIFMDEMEGGKEEEEEEEDVLAVRVDCWGGCDRRSVHSDPAGIGGGGKGRGHVDDAR
jgi:hypothetical protein